MSYCKWNIKKILAYDKENKDENFHHIDYGFFGIIKKDFIRIAPPADLLIPKNLFNQQSKKTKFRHFLPKKDSMTSVILKPSKNLLIFIKKFFMKNIILIEME